MSRQSNSAGARASSPGSSQTSAQTVRRFLESPANTLEERLGILSDLKRALDHNATELSISIAEATGKAMKWATAEVGDASKMLASPPELSGTSFSVDDGVNFAETHAAFDARGTALVFPDPALPVSSTISKVIPSVLTREKAIVFPPSESARLLNKLVGLLDCKALGNDVLFAYLNERSNTYSVLHSPRPVDVLISGRTDVARISRLHQVSMLSVDAGYGYPVHVNPGADLDACAEEAARAMVSLNLPQHFRPGEVTIFREDEEYFSNRLVAEVEKLIVGNAMESNTDVGKVMNEGLASAASHLISRNRGKRFDVPMWGGFADGIFHPCVISGIEGDLDPEIAHADLPLIRIRVVKSIEETKNAALNSGNGIATSLWSHDLDLLPYAMKRWGSSVIYFNSMIKKIPRRYINPAFGSNPAGGPAALFEVMRMGSTGYLRL